MNIEHFLADYKAICEKHGAIVHSCGCCGSPWVTTLDVSETLDQHIDHLRQEWANNHPNEGIYPGTGG